MTPVLFCLLLFFLASRWYCLRAAADGNWGQWSDWTSCSVSCSAGTRKRFRACDSAPKLGGVQCKGTYLQTEQCDTGVECPVNGGWGSWSLWTPCSNSCGEGSMQRFRSCSDPIPLHGGRPCSGMPQETQRCFALKSCPRDGGWSSWSKWSACSVTCGGGGSMHRYRSCNNPPPTAEGRPCQGSGHDIRECTSTVKCPVNGQWVEWTPWSECSVTCGEGERMRQRTCDNPPPQFGGEDCDRTEAGELQTHSCTGPLLNCPVDGGWSDWGEWGPCHSPNCLMQTVPSRSFRQRSCSSPLPRHEGRMCQGAFLDAGLCSSPLNCKVDGGWGEWSSWNCTRFVASRRRWCDKPAPENAGKRCKGKDVQFHVRGEDTESYREACPDFSTDDEDMDDLSGTGPLSDIGSGNDS